MGVPKFFRYISERYPCLSELAREQGILQFDNLYLDMNGIIHNCSHPDDGNIHFNITEEQMFKDIFSYIDKLFFIIKPQKLFFMAVDGVAPRAKMNQQRSRRFRSAKEAEVLEAKAVQKGMVREHERFDSNCITPGTEFMARLQEALRCFVKVKISRDPLWQKCRIILSGHDCPGEGEHKIMDYIRYLKTQPDYEPRTQHCIYGLDADLILLGLCTHELHFVVLREEVKFGRKNKRASLEETRFYLLHLNLLREYLELEFAELREHEANFSIGKLIDDWVLMGFLVGNDFIPHLPCLHISTNALPLLYKTYIKVYPSLGGNINVKGKLHLERLEKFFEALSVVEFDIFQEHHADLKYFEAKQSKNGIDEAFDFDVSEINNDDLDADLAALIEDSKQFLGVDDDDDCDEAQHIQDEFEAFKRNYYMNKLNQHDMSIEDKRDQAIGYITALQWVLDYYYRGVQSWDWYYPHHYAPFISDLKNFKDYEFNFKLGTPFLPFQQLLAVLPAASKELLPRAYQELMISEKSSLIDFYPNNFETDLNGKQHEWEAVVLIPFIDEKLLLNAMRECDSNLSEEEVQRNRHGPMYQYEYNSRVQGTETGGCILPILYAVYCTEKPIWSREIAVPSDKTVCVEIDEMTADDTHYTGRPSMKHLNFNFELRHARVKVFDYPSRNENMILMPSNRTELNELSHVAEKYLNEVIHIGWPHLIKSKVIAVSNETHIINSDGITKEMESKLHQLHVRAAQEHLMNRMGIEFADFSVLVHVRTSVGLTYGFNVDHGKGKMTAEDLWNDTITVYPAQGVVIPSKERTRQIGIKELEDFFPVGSKIFFVGNPYFGSEGTVLRTVLFYKCKRILVDITALPEPDFSEAKRMQYELERDYINSNEAAAIVGLNARALGRLTGSLLIVNGSPRTELPDQVSKANIGLMLKFPKKQEERAGYARRINNQWLYSSKAISLIQKYCMQFPEVIVYLSRSSDRFEYCFESDIFPEQTGEGKIDEIVAWLKEQPYSNVDRIACGSKTMEREAMENVLTSIGNLKSLPVKTVKLQVKPHLLLKPDITLPHTYKPTRPVCLFDRIVIVKSTYMVPLGSKGTVVGIYPVTDSNPVRFECIKAVDNFLEVLFDKVLPSSNLDSMDLDNGRIQKVPESCVLLIYTHDDNKAIMPQTWRNNSDNTVINNSNTINSNNHNNNNKTNGNGNDNKNNNDKASTAQFSNQMCDANTSNAQEEPSTSLQAQSLQKQQQQPQQKQQQLQQQQVPSTTLLSRKGGDDFWLPKPDTKIKHENQKQQLQQQQQTFFNNNSNNNNNNNEEDDDEDSIEQFKTKSNRKRRNKKNRPRLDDDQNADQSSETVWHMANSSINSNPDNNSSNSIVATAATAAAPTQSNSAPTALQQFLLGVKANSYNTQPSLPQPAASASVATNNPKDCQAETMVLRNLLGISTNSTTTASTQHGAIDAPTVLAAAKPMHEQFKAQLPQPPLGWRSDAQHANTSGNSSNDNNNSNAIIKAQPQQVQQQSQQQQQQQQQQLPMPVMSAFRPAMQTLPYNNNNNNINNNDGGSNTMFPTFRPSAPPKYVPPPTIAATTFFQPATQTQQQKLQQQQQQQQIFFNSGSLKQQGAFIPLQALRQQHKRPTQNEPRTQSLVDVEQTLSNLWLNASKTEMSQNSQVRSTNGNSSKEMKLQNAQQKAPRPSKIAAKFDNIQ